MRDNKGQFGLFFRNKESYKLDIGLSQTCFPPKNPTSSSFFMDTPTEGFSFGGGNFMKGK